MATKSGSHAALEGHIQGPQRRGVDELEQQGIAILGAQTHEPGLTRLVSDPTVNQSVSDSTKS